ncbi:alpha-glycosidase, partial [Escherichia coli]|nr:alpha-glycosidase [Escherichia coli]
HDTPRLLTVCEGDVRRMKLPVMLLLTYPGVPCIYYGDEVGLEGGYDPGCRKCMEWDETRQNRELLDFYTRIITLRKTHSALRGSNWRIVHAAQEDGASMIERTDDGGHEHFRLLMNAGESPRVLQLPLPEQASWRDAFSGEVLTSETSTLD